jgi:RHS repeat-associated protein
MHLPYSQVVAEYSSNGSLIADYAFGLDRISMRRGGNTYTYSTDGQGSIRQITSSSGTVTDTYDYYAFGEVLSRTGTTVNEFTYTGEQFDPNAGFYYLRARWYDPKDGRFASVDQSTGKKTEPISLHRYLYANASPLNFTDPSGKFTLVDVMDAVAVYCILQAVAIPVSHLYYAGGRRPDGDKMLTFIETALWWKHGNGKELTVDLDKIAFSISASDFDSIGQKKTFNFASFCYYSNFNTALVYGRLRLTLVSVNTVVETDGGDTYDFDIPDPLNPDLVVRNVETAGGAVLHGPGKPFRININGTKTIDQ